MDLETQTDRRLRAAGFTEDDPGLEWIRLRNAQQWARRDAGEQRSYSGSHHRSRGTDSGRDSTGSPVAPRQRARSRNPAGRSGAHLRAV